MRRKRRPRPRIEFGPGRFGSGIAFGAGGVQNRRMNVSSWQRGLGAAVFLWAATTIALGGAPEPIMLTVLGTNYTARELGVEADSASELLTTRAFQKIQGGIMGAFIEKLNYQPSEEELKEYCRRSAPTPEEMDSAFGNEYRTSLSAEDIFNNFWQEWQQNADDPGSAMRMAASDLKQWKYAQALHERYGGRVYVAEYLVSGVPDAVRAHLEDCEAAGDFTIHDAALRERFWKLLRTPSPVSLVSEEEGRAVLAEHPADRQKRWAMRSIKERLARTNRTTSAAEPSGDPPPP